MLTNAITPPGSTTASPIKLAAAPSVPVTPLQARDDVTAREVIAIANKTMRSLSNGLEFSLDPDSGKIVVRVVDNATHQVIRQFPSEEVLSIARALDRMQGLLINHKA